MSDFTTSLCVSVSLDGVCEVVSEVSVRLRRSLLSPLDDPGHLGSTSFSSLVGTVHQNNPGTFLEFSILTSKLKYIRVLTLDPYRSTGNTYLTT